MSQEPHPPTDQTSPGSTPAQEPGAAGELERQRAEGDYPPPPKRDPLEHRPTSGDEVGPAEAPTAEVEVPPSETVPDEVAQRAAQDVDPLAGDPDPGMQHQNPMRPASASSDIQKERPPAEDL